MPRRFAVMSAQAPSRAGLVWILLALWLAAFLWAFVAFRLAEPTGDGFLRGSNRAGVFFGWQLASQVPGVAAFVVSRPLPRGALRRLACIPIGLLGGAAALVLALIVWARVQILFHPPLPATAPPTAPATEAAPVPE